MKLKWVIVGTSTLLSTMLSSSAHLSPGDVIHTLTDRIEEEGAPVDLLIDRAYEYRSMGKWDAAIADFGEALEKEPRSRSAIYGRAEALLHLDALPEAVSMIRRGIALDEDSLGQSPFYALLARVFTRESRWSDALDAWRLALRSPSPEIDWFLGEAEMLARLDRFSERVTALARATEINPSIVLRRAWVRALVDAGELDVASREIENGITQSRYQSSWLLLRAQVHGQQQRFDKQREDARAVFREIQSRINTERPDPYLMLEAAQALILMGEKNSAHCYIEKLRNLGVPEEQLALLTQTIGATP